MLLDAVNFYPGYRVAEKPGYRPVFGNNQSGLSPAIKDDLDSVTGGFKYVRDKMHGLDRFERANSTPETQKALDTTEKFLFLAGVSPTCRRLNSVPKDLRDGNPERAFLMAAVAASCFPGDFREVAFAGKDLKNIFTGKLATTAADRAQHSLSFLRGTFFEKYLKKFDWLGKIDKTLYETKLGEFITDKLGIKEVGIVEKKLKVGIFKKQPPISIFATVLEGGFFKRLAGNFLLRTNLIGLAVSAAIEIPAVIKSAMVEGSIEDKTKSVTKQTLKSAGMVALVTGGISLCGAAAFMLCPPAAGLAALTGMAVGSALGVMGSKALNEQIDKILA